MKIKDLTNKYEVKRANPDSPFGKKHPDLAFAVDTHGCLLYLCEKTENPHEFVPVKVTLSERGDLPFEKLYGPR